MRQNKALFVGQGKSLEPCKYGLSLCDFAESRRKRPYKTIFSNYDAWYFDCGYAGWVTDGSNWCSPYKGNFMCDIFYSFNIRTKI